MPTPELKSCPFCGGEVAEEARVGETLWIEHTAKNPDCPVFADGIWARAGEWNTRAIEATRPPIGTDEVVERVVSEAVDNVRNARTKGGFGGMLDEEALMLLMLNELHANMPEVDRPMSMSDLSDEQAQRARNAVRKVLVASMLSAPAGRFSSLTELENAMKDVTSD